MPEAHTELTTDFTTADTVGPVAIHFDGEHLVLSFANFRTPIHKVMFHNTRAFTWKEWYDGSPEACYDGVCEVTGSRLLEPYLSCSVGGIPFRHYKLGFNAEAKFLDVIATRMERFSSPA